MKNLKLGLLGILAMFLITSCEVDPIDPGTGPGGGGTIDEGPELVFVDQAGSLIADAKVAPGEFFTVTLQGAKGSTNLKSLTIHQDDARIDDFANRITIEGTPANSSAFLLTNTNPETLLWNVTIKAQEDARKSIYKFILADDNDNSVFRDIEIDTEATGSGTIEPSLTLQGLSNFIVMPSTLAGINVTALAGNSELLNVAVLDENLDPIDFARCYLGDITVENQFTANPQMLSADDLQGFAKTLYIRAQGDESIAKYTIAVQDAANEVAFQEVIINTYPNGIAGAPLTTMEGVLFNRAGPAGTGGLDLDSGASTGSSDTAAELKDNGIDINQGTATNWIQRISGANNTTLKQLIPNANGLAEDFNFGSVTTDTQLLDIWESGSDLVGVNSNQEAWTEEVQVGDMYIAERGGKYYMIVVRSIFIDDTGNNDSYTMDIKL